MHVNYRRGETRAFVWKRDRMGCTTRMKGKAQSHIYWRKMLNDQERTQAKKRLSMGDEKPERQVHPGSIWWHVY